MLCRKQIIEAVFLSVLDYGDVIYRNATASALTSLDSVYHSALRFITGSSYSTHHCVLYEKVGWAPLSVRRQKHWLLFIYKVLNGNMPPYLSTLLNWSNNKYSTRSTDFLMLDVPRTKTEFGKAAFSSSAASSWNISQQTLELNKMVSIGQFKTMVINYCTFECNCF